MTIHILFFFIFIISFADKDAVYINSVIIPEEKVKITTNAIHLEIVYLNTITDEIIEIIKIQMAIKIGFMFFFIVVDRIIVEIKISFISFDLQNQCFIKLSGILISCVLFFIGFLMLIFYRVHYIILLLVIEILLLSTFLVLCVSFLFSEGLSGLFLFILVMVCIGGFGISLLVSMARLFGRDF